MQPRSKVVSLAGHKFQVRKLPPEVGSFILMRMLGTSMRAAANAPSLELTEEQLVEAAKITGEMRVRAMAFNIFSGGVSFDDYKFIQEHCMKVSAIMLTRAEVESPQPIMMADGSYTPDGQVVADSITLLTQLPMEVLILCFADFFDASSPGSPD